MSHQVCWTRVIVDAFVQEAMLSEDEEMVIRTRAAGWTITKRSMELGMSTSTINNIIKRLKVKYDQCQKHKPILPPRKFSAKETYMDTH